MSKLTHEEKINLYKNIKSGLSIYAPVSKYNVITDNIKYLIRLINKHELDILRTTKIKYYPPDLPLVENK